MHSKSTGNYILWSGYPQDFKNQIPCIFPSLIQDISLCIVCKNWMLNELFLVKHPPSTPNAINLEWWHKTSLCFQKIYIPCVLHVFFKIFKFRVFPVFFKFFKFPVSFKICKFPVFSLQEKKFTSFSVSLSLNKIYLSNNYLGYNCTVLLNGSFW